MHFIFDLDDTVINTSHRQRLLADGSIDLEFWRANCTVGMVARDKLLPLASKMQGAIRDGLDVIVCTSRVMGAADFAFLRAHKMLGNVMLSRMGGDERGSAFLNSTNCRRWQCHAAFNGSNLLLIQLCLMTQKRFKRYSEMLAFASLILYNTIFHNKR